MELLYWTSYRSPYSQTYLINKRHTVQFLWPYSVTYIVSYRLDQSSENTIVVRIICYYKLLNRQAKNLAFQSINRKIKNISFKYKNDKFIVLLTKINHKKKLYFRLFNHTQKEKKLIMHFTNIWNRIVLLNI